MTTLEPRTNLGPERRACLPSPAAARPAPFTSLAQAVQAAARALPEEMLRRVAPANAGLAFHPRTVVALLGYCYACDIYSSDDVEDVMRRDIHFRQLCQEEFPDARTLRHFRRHNHGAVQQCLAAALRFLVEQNRLPTHRGASIEAEIAAETKRRIDTAVLIDMA